ncbi:unnamed protein product [Schistosoma curassoni]|uniref:Cytochrome-c oxidase n=1 Tax=Schistosoma curassoni TaxID=6186 RepID=A0A183JZP1_9TREM|nr:unnamed protein product [Schistosoma curassoni]
MIITTTIIIIIGIISNIVIWIRIDILSFNRTYLHGIFNMVSNLSSVIIRIIIIIIATDNNIITIMMSLCFQFIGSSDSICFPCDIHC